MVAKRPASVWADVIRWARKARHLTQAGLAEEAGVAPGTISSIEGGKSATPRDESLKPLAEFFGYETPERLKAAYLEHLAQVSSTSESAAIREMRAQLTVQAQQIETLTRLVHQIPKGEQTASLPPVPPTPTVPPFVVLPSGLLHFGEGAAEPDEATVLPLIPDSLRDRYTAFQAQGDCMEPLVKNGWWVMVDKEAPRAPGQMVAVQLPGQGLSARWYMPKNGHVEFLARAGRVVKMTRADAANAIYGAVIQIGVPPVDAWKGLGEV